MATEKLKVGDCPDCLATEGVYACFELYVTLDEAHRDYDKLKASAREELDSKSESGVECGCGCHWHNVDDYLGDLDEYNAKLDEIVED